ncbi:MAG: hypothetical protein ILP01_02700 [Clostridia bacterium]|nr:hypothetical protein [Clostridia bacterium]
MQLFLCALFFIFLSAGILLLLDITPDRVAADITSLLTAGFTLRERALTVQKRRKRSAFAREIMHIRNALDTEGRKSGFGAICLFSLFLTVSGAVLAFVLGNYWLLPVALLAGAVLPFIFAHGSIESYDSRLETELETALSIITSTYVRTGDIVGAVESNLSNIRPPVSDIFRKFVNRTSLVTSDIPGCIRMMKESSDNRVFKEWCDTLIACQDDATNRFTLMPIVSKLTEIRLVNSEMYTVIAGCRREYWSMVMILIGNIPLLRLINRDWFNVLFTTIPGRIVTAFCGAVIIVTAFLMEKYTRPIKYG